MAPISAMVLSTPPAAQAEERRGPMDVWGEAIVAVGPVMGTQPTPLMGSGFVVDSDAGLICSCAHVLLQCQQTVGAQDPLTFGLAIGVGDPIQWLHTAKIVSVRYPPRMDPPDHWIAQWPIHPMDVRMDLVVLKLEPQPASPTSAWPRALPLGDSSRLRQLDMLVCRAPCEAR